MRSRRMMNGKRRKRSSCLNKTEKHDIGAGVEVVMRKPENYAPTESEKYNPMEQASSGLSQNKMDIERDKQ
jgi:hypothetical protein